MMEAQFPLSDPIPSNLNQPLPLESASQDQTEDEITLIPFDSVDTGYAYNVPDAFEQDPEILRAELLFYNTPQTEQFNTAVYYSLKNVQDQCSIDYLQFCGQGSGVSDSFPFSLDADLTNNLANLFTAPATSNRKLSEVSENFSGRRLINSFRALYNHRSLAQNSRLSEKETNLHIPVNPVHPHVIRTEKIKKREEKLKTATESSSTSKIASISRRQLRSKLDKHEHEGRMSSKMLGHGMMGKDDNQHDGPPPRGPPPRGPPRDEKPPRGPSGEKPPLFDSDSESDSEDDDHPKNRRHHDKHDRDQMMSPRGMPQLEDTFFPGALGYGAQGDICMYQNADKLSQPCLQSIADVYSLRQMYWENQSQPYHHGHGFFLFLIGLALIFGFKRLFFYKRHQNIRNLLQGLHNNPDLKNMVEAKLGVEVPKACPHGHGRQCAQGSLCKKILFTVGFLIFSLIASLCVAVSSLEITASIVNHIDSHHSVDSETGEVHSVSPMFALFILFTVSLLEMSLVVFVIRKLKKLYLKHCNNDSSPSAPVEQDANGPMPPSHPNNGTGISYIPVMMNNWMSRAFSTFGRRRYPEGYVPLNPDDSTEMIAVGSIASAPDQPRYAVYTGVPLNPHNVTVVPVTASPVNTVSFV